MSIKNNTWIIIFAILSVFSIIFINYGRLGDNNENFLPIIHSIEDPDYLSNDSFVQDTNGYNVRFFYTHLIYYTNKIFKNYHITIPLLNFIATILISSSIFLLANIFVDKKKALFISIGTTFGMHYSLVKVYLIDSYLSPNRIAYGLILLGIYFILKKKKPLGYFIMGSAMIFHTIIPTLMYISVLGSHSLVLIHKKRFKETLKEITKSLSFFILYSINFIGLLLLNSKTHSIAEKNLISLYMRFRYIVHVSPFSFPLTSYIITISFFVLTFILIKRNHKNLLPYWTSYTSINLVILIIGTIFVEIIPNDIVIKACLFRILVFYNTFSFMIILYHIYDKIRIAKNIIQKISLIIILSFFFIDPLIPIGIFFTYLTIIKDKSPISKNMILPAVISILSAAILFTIIKWQRITYLLNDNPFRLIQRTGIYLLSIQLFLTLMYLFFSKSNKLQISEPKKKSNTFTKKQSILFISLIIAIILSISLVSTKGNYYKNKCTIFYNATQFIQKNTPTESIFLIPPYNPTFRICTDRSTVVDSISVYTDDAILRNYEKLCKITKQENLDFQNDTLISLNNKYHTLNTTDIISLSKLYNFQYAIMYPQYNNTLDLPIIYTDQYITMYLVIW